MDPSRSPLVPGNSSRFKLSSYICDGLAQELRLKWTDAKSMSESDTDIDNSNKKAKIDQTGPRIYTKPFRCVVLPNLLDCDQDDKLVKNLETAANQIQLGEKNNDLYRFRQSKDIGQLKQGKIRILKQFVHFISNQVMEFVECVTGFQLDHQHVDVTVSKYDCKEYLLCHDDDIRGKKHARKVAFVYYLVDDAWSSDDGGSLIMYDTPNADNNDPVSVAQRLIPSRNSLVFFETNSKSWHSVEEVKRPKGGRLSINGWFHTPIELCNNQTARPILDLPSYRPCPLSTVPLSHGDEDVRNLEQLFLTWVNHDYMMDKTWKKIRRQFSESSEINLTDFLAYDKYKELCNALSSCRTWNHVGPYNMRNYKQLDDTHYDSMPDVCKELLRLFKSGMFFMMLSKLTGLKFHPDADDDDDDDEDDDDDGDEGHKRKCDKEEDSSSSHSCSDVDSNASNQSLLGSDGGQTSPGPRSRMEFRLWEAGHYTLVHDHSHELREKNVLDCILHFNHDANVDFHDGGYISYIAKDEDEELLTIEPKSNCLSLVYRDSETARFVKCLSSAHGKPYYDLSCVFYQ